MIIVEKIVFQIIVEVFDEDKFVECIIWICQFMVVVYEKMEQFCKMRFFGCYGGNKEGMGMRFVFYYGGEYYYGGYYGYSEFCFGCMGMCEYSWGKLFKNIILYILFLVFIGFVVGVVVSLIGMVVGIVIVGLWCFFCKFIYIFCRYFRCYFFYKVFYKEVVVVEEKFGFLVEEEQDVFFVYQDVEINIVVKFVGEV